MHTDDFPFPSEENPPQSDFAEICLNLSHFGALYSFVLLGNMAPDQSQAKRKPCDSAFDNVTARDTQQLNDSSKPSNEQLEELAKDIVEYWKHLARKLGMHSEINRIQKDHYNYDDICEKALAMLTAWRELPHATIGELKAALVKLEKDRTARKHFGPF